MWLPEHSLQPFLGTSPLLSLEQLFSLTTDTQTHAHTLLCTDTQDANTHVCTYRHTHSRTGTYRYTQAHKYTHTFTHRCTQAHTVGTSTHRCTQVHTRAHTHTSVHAALAQGPSDNLRTGCAVRPAWLGSTVPHLSCCQAGRRAHGKAGFSRMMQEIGENSTT